MSPAVLSSRCHQGHKILTGVRNSSLLRNMTDSGASEQHTARSFHWHWCKGLVCAWHLYKTIAYGTSHLVMGWTTALLVRVCVLSSLFEDIQSHENVCCKIAYCGARTVASFLLSSLHPLAATKVHVKCCRPWVPATLKAKEDYRFVQCLPGLQSELRVWVILSQ